MPSSCHTDASLLAAILLLSNERRQQAGGGDMPCHIERRGVLFLSHTLIIRRDRDRWRQAGREERG